MHIQEMVGAYFMNKDSRSDSFVKVILGTVGYIGRPAYLSRAFFFFQAPLFLVI